MLSGLKDLGAAAAKHGASNGTYMSWIMPSISERHFDHRLCPSLQCSHEPAYRAKIDQSDDKRITPGRAYEICASSLANREKRSIVLTAFLSLALRRLGE